jgi:hypothetical protein
MGIERGAGCEAVVCAAVKAVASAVVAVLADGVVVVERGGEGRERIQRGLNIVDAATVVVEDSVGQEAEAFRGAEASAGGAAEVIRTAAVQDVGATAVAIEIEGRTLAGFFGDEVDRGPDAVAVHIRQERLIHLDGVDHSRRDHIEAHLADGGFGGGNGDAIHGHVGQARFCAANLDVDAFALDPIERDGGKATDGVGDVRVGETGDDLRRHDLQEIVGAAGLVDRLGFPMRARRGDQDSLAGIGDFQGEIQVQCLAGYDLDRGGEGREANVRDREGVGAGRDVRDTIVPLGIRGNGRMDRSQG